MIIDRIDRLVNYQVMISNIDKALFKVNEFKDWEAGVHYPFDGGFLFFQKGTTKSLTESQFEAHKKYIDVQLVLEGAEYIALEDLSNLTLATAYNDERDVEKYNGMTEHTMKITAGMGYICFPWDIHKAVFHIEHAENFTKAVIKLEI